MKIISWNVNGIRSCMTKGFNEFISKENPDIICIGETKMQEGQADIFLEGYHMYMNSALKKGYSGTLVYTKVLPISVVYGIDEKYNDEGRVITCEYEDFYLVNVYTPNSKEGLTRLDYRMIYEDDLRNYLVALKLKKNVILCGDLNVAHNEIDLKNPKANIGNAGFSYEEREKFGALLGVGFSDTYRNLYPTKVQYSWWSYRFKAREKNIGWRIDYFVVNNEFMTRIKDSIIHDDIFGSDHAPISLIF